MQSMDHQVSLILECREASPGKLTFALLLTNESTERLLLPYPEITGMQFSDVKSDFIVEWTTHKLVHTKGLNTPVFESGASRLFLYTITGNGRLTDSRWGIKLEKGAYKVWYVLSVDEDFFDGDSHWRWGELEKQAAKHGAIAWKGSVRSNEILVNG